MTPSGPPAAPGAPAGGALVAPEILAALREIDFEPLRCAPVSPLGDAKGRRAAHRVEDAAGRVVKVRRFEDATAAGRVFRLRQGLDAAFAAPLACRGPVLVEAWVPGRPLADPEAAARVAEAGEILGRLHARPLPRGESGSVRSDRWVDGCAGDARLLVEAGLLAPDEAARLCESVVALAPSPSRTVLAHLDFCAANMVIDDAGQLRVVDNEMFEVRPPGLDLGRTFALWPMPDDCWRRFRLAYVATAGEDAADLDFWRLVATAMAARILCAADPVRRDECLSRLREFLRLGRFEAAG